MPDIQIPNSVIVGLQLLLAFSGAFMLAIWVSLIIWTFRDAKLRSRDIFAILLATLMVVIFGPLGLLIYFLLRPPTTLSELYERSLEEEALLQDLEERAVCPGCRRKIEEEWQVCPDCHTILKKRCLECGNLLNLRWNICPYCVAPAPDAHNHHRKLQPSFTREPATPAEIEAPLDDEEYAPSLAAYPQEPFAEPDMPEPEETWPPAEDSGEFEPVEDVEFEEDVLSLPEETLGVVEEFDFFEVEEESTDEDLPPNPEFTFPDGEEPQSPEEIQPESKNE